MIGIKDLLKKVEGVLFREEMQRLNIKNAIKELTGAEIDSREIKFTGREIQINTDPIAKNLIFQRRADILTLINSKNKTVFEGIR